MLQQKIMNALRNNILYGIIQNYWHKKDYLKRDYLKWILSSKPIPPPRTVKQMIVKAYAAKYRLKVLVETGTYLGEMVNAVKYSFKKIYSIELSSDLHKRAEKKFSKYKHIEILKGDSSVLLPEILNQIYDPCLFWLDAHYSGGITEKGDIETPILEELKQIFLHSVKNHVILIDDARCFTGQNDYPSIEELNKFIFDQNPYYLFNVVDDVIRVCK